MHFNQNIDNIKFPSNLHAIRFGDMFNQNIDNVKFPDSMHTIGFGWSFDQSLDNVKFPDSFHTIDLQRTETSHISRMFIPYTVKEVLVSKQNKGIVKLPFGCVESYSLGSYFFCG